MKMLKILWMNKTIINKVFYQCIGVGEMDWFNVFKNKPTEQEMNSLTNIKGYAYDVKGGGYDGLPNVGVAKEVASAANWA